MLVEDDGADPLDDEGNEDDEDDEDDDEPDPGSYELPPRSGEPPRSLPPPIVCSILINGGIGDRLPELTIEVVGGGFDPPPPLGGPQDPGGE